jgi:predicted nuclease of predicted toxin-antitoxin system
MLRFHLDENVDQAIAIGLRGRGIDVTTTPEAGLRGASDVEQLEHCLRAKRVIVSHDDDLLTLDSQGAVHAGVAWCRTGSRTIGQIVLKLAALSRKFFSAEFMGRVEFL